MFKTFINSVRNALFPSIPPMFNPRKALKNEDLNNAVGLLLRECKNKDEVRRIKAKAALKHISAARTLQELGYDSAVVNFVASNGFAAYRAA